MPTVERLITRENGSEVKVVAQACYGAGLHLSIDVRVLRRDSPAHAWHLTNDRPHPDWRSMSVDEYIKNGRSEMLRTATPGEILKTVSTLTASLVH